MERNSLSASFKDHILNGTVTTNSNKNQMMKESWDCNNSQISSGGDEYMNGFSWPPRSYACSFCKREFRSAQALGGHMNVHRRDRARLRQSPPTTTDDYSHMLNLKLSPTSGPSFSTTTLSLLSSPSSSSTMLKKPFSASTFPSLFSPTLSSSSHPPSASPSSELKKWAVDGILSNPSSTKASESTKLKNAESLSGFGEYDDAFAQEDAYKVIKKAEIIRLDLEIGLLSDSKDDLDLELRLGTYS